MNPNIKKIVKATAVICAAVFLYYSAVLIIASKNTPALLEKFLAPESISLTSNQLTKDQLEILIKVQDPGFYSHKGVDFTTPGNGLTTITQAIVKKMYFTRFTPGIGKIKQTLIARYIGHLQITKKQQLDIFINICWFDKGCTGFSSAARLFYNKEFKDLSKDEYISIIAMISSPAAFHILKRPASNKERVRRIKMLVSGEYRPKSLMDQFYGKLTEEEQNMVAPASYFESIYD